MATFWESLSEPSREKWKLLCEQFGTEPELPEKDERGIHIQPKLENLDEITKLMCQKPHGRMGRG